MPCVCCTCETCKKDQIKTKLIASMPFEVRNQVQSVTVDWFLNKLVDLEYRLKKETQATNVQTGLAPFKGRNIESY